MQIILLCLLVSAGYLIPVSAQSENVTEKTGDKLSRLNQKLLGNYDINVPPFVNGPLDVTVHLQLTNIIELIESKETLITRLYMYEEWDDYRLIWNSSDWNNISQIKIPFQKIWYPDIRIFNSLENTDYHAVEQGLNAIVYNTGRVHVVLPWLARTSCIVDMRRFPYDVHNCSIIVGSWSYDDNGITLTGQSAAYADNSLMSANRQWQFMAIQGKVIVQRFSCCPDGYPIFQGNVIFQRKAAFYIYMFISPAVLFSLLTPVLFIIPPSSGERTTLGSILLLCLLGLLQMLDQHLPPQQDKAPILGIYYTVTMVFVSLALALSAFILNMQSRGVRQNGVPLLLRKIFLGPIKRLVFLDSETFRPYSNLTPTGGRPMTPGGSSELKRPQAEMNTPSSLENRLGELINQMANLNYVRERQQIIDSIVTDWQQLVQVVDRILFIFFLVITLIVTISMLG